jgi:hypothetical protein
MAYSDDNCLSWNTITIFSKAVYFVKYFPVDRIWLAGGEGLLHTLAVSKDGKSWIGLGNSVFSEYCTGISYNEKGGLFLACGLDKSGQSIAYSTSGLKWTKIHDSTLKIGQHVAINPVNGRAVVVGVGNAGVSLVYADYPYSRWCIGNTKGSLNRFGLRVACNGEQWVATGTTSGFGSTGLIWSKDGENWFPVVGSDQPAFSVCWVSPLSMWIIGLQVTSSSKSKLLCSRDASTIPFQPVTGVPIDLMIGAIHFDNKNWKFMIGGRTIDDNSWCIHSSDKGSMQKWNPHHIMNNQNILSIYTSCTLRNVEEKGEDKEVESIGGGGGVVGPLVYGGSLLFKSNSDTKECPDIVDIQCAHIGLCGDDKVGVVVSGKDKVSVKRLMLYRDSEIGWVNGNLLHPDNMHINSMYFVDGIWYIGGTGVTSPLYYQKSESIRKPWIPVDRKWKTGATIKSITSCMLGRARKTAIICVGSGLGCGNTNLHNIMYSLNGQKWESINVPGIEQIKDLIVFKLNTICVLGTDSKNRVVVKTSIDFMKTWKMNLCTSPFVNDIANFSMACSDTNILMQFGECVYNFEKHWRRIKSPNIASIHFDVCKQKFYALKENKQELIYYEKVDGRDKWQTVDLPINTKFKGVCGMGNEVCDIIDSSVRIRLMIGGGGVETLNNHKWVPIQKLRGASLLFASPSTSTWICSCNAGLFRSSDKKIWTIVHNDGPFMVAKSGVANRWVIIHTKSGLTLTSDDGKTFTQHPTNVKHKIKSLQWNSKDFSFILNNNMKSVDGIIWS